MSPVSRGLIAHLEMTDYSRMVCKANQPRAFILKDEFGNGDIYPKKLKGLV